MSTGLLGHSRSKKGNREIKFIFGSSAVKATITSYEWLTIVHEMFSICSFLPSFIHSFMVYLVTPIGNSDQPSQNIFVHTLIKKIRTAKTQRLISEP